MLKLPKCHPAPLFTFYHPHARLSLSFFFSHFLNTPLFLPLALPFISILLNYLNILLLSLVSALVFFLHPFAQSLLSRPYIVIHGLINCITGANLPNMRDSCPLFHSCSPAYRMSVSVLRELNRVRPFPWVDQTKSLALFTSV